MLLYEKEIIIPAAQGHKNLIYYLSKQIKENLDQNETPIRFVITQSDQDSYKCEIGLLSGRNHFYNFESSTIMDFNKRSYESTNQFNVVLRKGMQYAFYREDLA